MSPSVKSHSSRSRAGKIEPGTKSYRIPGWMQGPAPLAKRKLGFFGYLVRVPVLVAVLYCVLSVFTGFALTSVWLPSSSFVQSEDWERVTIPTSDGIDLAGWFLGEGRFPVVVLAHDYLESASHGAVLAKLLHMEDFDVLAFDFRAHGDSSGSKSSLGRLEAQDVEAVFEWLKKRGVRLKNVGWIGDSLGSAAFLMAPSSPEVGAAILMGACQNADQRLDGWMRSWLPFGLHPGGELMLKVAEARLGFRFEATKPLDALVEHGRTSLLFLVKGDVAANLPPEVAALTGNPHTAADIRIVNDRTLSLKGLEANIVVRVPVIAFLRRTIY